MRKTKAHSKVVEVDSVPARNRSTEHRARLVSVKPRSDSLCYSEMHRRYKSECLLDCQEGLHSAMQLFTYILHFNDERVNVVPGVAVVQVLLVTLYLLRDEV